MGQAWQIGVSIPPPRRYVRRVAGIPPILMTGRLPDFDYDLLFEVNPGTEQQVFPLRQVVFAHPLLERPRAVPLHDRMLDNPEFLMEQLREWGLERGQPIRAFAMDEEIPRLTAVLQQLGYTAPNDWAVTTYAAQRFRSLLK